MGGAAGVQTFSSVVMGMLLSSFGWKGTGGAGRPLPGCPAFKAMRRLRIAAGQSAPPLSRSRLIDTSLCVAQICSSVRDSLPPDCRFALPDRSPVERSTPMSRDTLSDLLRTVRVRGAVFYYVSCSDPWSTEAPPAGEIAAAVMPGCEHVIEYHMLAKGHGWAADAGQPPVNLATGDIVLFPQGDRLVLSSSPNNKPLRR